MIKYWLFDRFKERSTWLGLISLLSGLGLSLSPEQADLIMQTGLGVAGGYLMMSADGPAKEKKKLKEPKGRQNGAK